MVMVLWQCFKCKKISIAKLGHPLGCKGHLSDSQVKKFI